MNSGHTTVIACETDRRQTRVRCKVAMWESAVLVCWVSNKRVEEVWSDYYQFRLQLFVKHMNDMHVMCQIKRSPLCDVSEDMQNVTD